MGGGANAVLAQSLPAPQQMIADHFAKVHKVSLPLAAWCSRVSCAWVSSCTRWCAEHEEACGARKFLCRPGNSQSIADLLSSA